MRIIAGKYRGRRIPVPPGTAIRPTADRTREALFNIIVHGVGMGDGVSPLADAVVLDAFCGSGAMGLEALSRGAATVTFLDKDARATGAVRGLVESLGAQHRVRYVVADARRPPPASEPADIAFLDPPYDSGMETEALQALAAAGWLRPGCLCIVETSARLAAAAPPGFEEVDRRVYGAAGLTFFSLGPGPSPRSER